LNEELFLLMAMDAVRSMEWAIVSPATVHYQKPATGSVNRFYQRGKMMHCSFTARIHSQKWIPLKWREIIASLPS
jgi:hypothetical protein